MATINTTTLVTPTLCTADFSLIPVSSSHHITYNYTYLLAHSFLSSRFIPPLSIHRYNEVAHQGES
jgi:hypothetical protein